MEERTAEITTTSHRHAARDLAYSAIECLVGEPGLSNGEQLIRLSLAGKKLSFASEILHEAVMQKITDAMEGGHIASSREPEQEDDETDETVTELSIEDAISTILAIFGERG